MSEEIKPDLTLNMKREWFEKVWNGEKTVETAADKPTKDGLVVENRGNIPCGTARFGHNFCTSAAEEWRMQHRI